jgi:hypothetical protein
VRLSPLAEALAGYADLAQARWAAWRRKHHLEDRLPSAFNDVLDAVIAFADPAVDGTAAAMSWNPTERAWA